MQIFYSFVLEHVKETFKIKQTMRLDNFGRDDTWKDKLNSSMSFHNGMTIGVV